MTGNLLLRAPGRRGRRPDGAERFGGPRLYERPRRAASAARILLDDGSELWFTDPRRFGHGVVLGRLTSSTITSPPGSGSSRSTEALTAKALCRLAAGRRAPLKSFLLNQTRVSGIGNIYADEALYRAALHPLSPAGSMKPEHCEGCARG